MLGVIVCLVPRQQANERLLVRIREEYQLSKKTYGSPRIHAALRQGGIVCNRKRVARLMHQNGLFARRIHRRVPRTTQRDERATPAPNRLDQDFSSPAPDRKWVSDFTYIDTAEGWLYLAVVEDLFSRRVVGWAMDEHMEAHWSSELGRWPSRSAALRPSCCITRIKVASTPAKSISKPWSLMAARSV